MGGGQTPAPQPLFGYGAVNQYAGQVSGTGGAGPAGVKSLQNITSGGNFQQIYNAIIAAQKQASTAGAENISQQFSSMGLESSSPAANAISSFLTGTATEYGQTVAQTELQETGYEIQSGSQLAQLYSDIGGAFYQPGYIPSAIPGLLGAGIGGIARVFSSMFGAQ
jgi:hypothetical protein